jgi:hypothetical protein
VETPEAEPGSSGGAAATSTAESTTSEAGAGGVPLVESTGPGGASGAPPVGGAAVGGAAVGGAAAGGDGAAGAPDLVADAGAGGGSASSDPGFTIRFDYRFDTRGMFDDPARRALLDFAASAWSSHIRDEFDDIPAGTEVLVRNPEDTGSESLLFVMEESIDDLLVFIGSEEREGAVAAGAPGAAIGCVSNVDLRAPLEARYNGPDFEPWTGRFSFNAALEFFYDATPETSDDISLDGPDLISVTIHELGHVLGVSTSNAYDALVQEQTLVGDELMAVFGGPVPLADDGNHFPDGLMIDGQMPIMDVSEERGFRVLPSRLDLALLADIGYEIE